jgi:nucleotide-binding universal stress UspA family protein
MPLFPTRILAAVDGSPQARYASEVAAQIASATASELHLLHIRPSSSTLHGRPVSEAEQGSMSEEAEALLAGAKAEIEAREGWKVTDVHVRYDESIDTALIAAQDAVEAGLLVIGEGRTGQRSRRLLGSSATSTVKRSHASILVARGVSPADAEA